MSTAFHRRRHFLQTTAGVAAAAALGRGAMAAATEPDSGEPIPFRVNHDLHTHTTYSDGAHPVPLHILEARAFELDAIAITDHYIPESPLATSEEMFQRYVAEIRRERGQQDDVLVIAGCEATAVDATGTISVDAQHAEQLEWTLCDLGGWSEGTLRHTPADKQKYMENVVRTYLGLCDVPFLNAIAHPFNTGNTQPAAFPADYPPTLLRELADKMAEKGKVFDVMNDMIYWFHQSDIAPRDLTAQYVEMVKLFCAAGVRFQVSSDDHRTGLGNTRWAQLVLARAAVSDAQIVDPRTIPLRG